MKDFDVELYTTDDVCKILKIGKVKCLKLFHSEDFPAQQLGRKFLVAKDAFIKYLSQKHVLKIKEDLISQIKPS